MIIYNSGNYSPESSIVDFSFYLIQRGEAGHKRGCYTDEYGDCGGIRTIGYGTVTEAGYNHLNYTSKTVTEERAVSLAKEEMMYKINEKCRTQFPNYDRLLPCYQALILDTTYQGFWTRIDDDFNQGNMQAVYNTLTNTSLPKNGNKERAAIRGRAIEMGMQIEAAYGANPMAEPRAVASLLAQQMIVKYRGLNGTDSELTRDELALLYRSTMVAYGVSCSEQDIRDFALSFPDVATGTHGIGSNGEQITPASADSFRLYQQQAEYVVNSVGQEEGVNSRLARAQTAQAEGRQAQDSATKESSTGDMIVGTVLEMIGMQALLKIVGNVLDTDTNNSSSESISAIASALISGKNNNT
ncbi:MAG: hypothetical protein J6V53_01835 [Alphaproteobacteria bacterium]|nr:hypothetical protein [Alphaproteobacteria bacterium]